MNDLSFIFQGSNGLVKASANPNPDKKDMAKTQTIFFILILAGASCRLQGRMELTALQSTEISQKVISDIITNWVRTDSLSEVYVDSILCERNALFGRQVFENPEIAYPGLFPKTSKREIIKYVIPDSLAQSVKYLSPSIDVENGRETVFFFSPLLKTKAESVYAIEVLSCYSMDAGYTFLRVASRSYQLYKIQKGNCEFIRQEPESSEMISLPLFKWNK